MEVLFVLDCHQEPFCRRLYQSIVPSNPVLNHAQNRYLPILHSAARLYAYSHENDEELSHIVSVHPVAASVSLFTAIGVSARRPGFDDKLNGILSRCGPVLDVAAYGSLVSQANQSGFRPSHASF